jgi:hypothetical protein
MYTRLFIFKKFGKYYTFLKDINDDNHEFNYTRYMLNNGYSHVGTHYVDNNGEATDDVAFKDNLYVKKR